MRMAFWSAASISANEAGSGALAAGPATPALRRGLMAGKRSPLRLPAVDEEAAVEALGAPSRPPINIPAPKPVRVRSATRMMLLVFNRGLFQEGPCLEPTTFPQSAKQKGVLQECSGDL